MRDYRSLENTFAAHLGIERRPVAIAFPEAPPRGVPAFEGTEPSGCSFWRLAAGGRAFYTVPRDHYNCAIGSYTHNLALPEERQQELGHTLDMMAGLGYLRMEEIPGVFRLPRSPRVIVYAPLGETPVEPEVVLFAGRPGRLMPLLEAAIRAGVESKLPLLPRPTCMAVPAALAHGLVTSGGCAGNRAYTGLGDDELYVAVPGRDLDRLAAELATIAAANASLREYHLGRRNALASE